MMRIAAILLATTTATATAVSVEKMMYTPVRISYADLAAMMIPQGEANVLESSPTSSAAAAKATIFVQALEDVGMISITDIPPSFADCKLKTLNSFQDCVGVVDASTAAAAAVAVEHTFPDGTVRRTMASHCLAGQAQKMMIQHDDDAAAAATSTTACGMFDKDSETFRNVVANVTETLAMALQAALNISSDQTLLKSKSRSFSLAVSWF
jgi:hypothetical protein